MLPKWQGMLSNITSMPQVEADFSASILSTQCSAMGVAEAGALALAQA
jgi:hypothetical protein